LISEKQKERETTGGIRSKTLYDLLPALALPISGERVRNGLDYVLSLLPQAPLFVLFILVLYSMYVKGKSANFYPII